MERLGGVLLKMASAYASKVRAVLMTNQQELARLMMHFDGKHELLPGVQLAGMPEMLMHCKALGTVLAVRRLLHLGARLAKVELFPSAVSSFIKGLGDQQLPDGQRAADGQLPVAELLASFGLVGAQAAEPPLSSTSFARDLLLDSQLDIQCGLTADKTLWQLLPYALGMSFHTGSFWDAAVPQLQENVVSSNIHTLAHAFDSLLAAVDPFMPKSRTTTPSTHVAHRTFLHVASISVGQQRLADRPSSEQKVKPQEIYRAQRSHAAMLLVLEQSVQLAGPLAYGDIPTYLLHTLVTSTYAHEVAQTDVSGTTIDEIPAGLPKDAAEEAAQRMSRQRQASTASFRDA